MPYIYFSYQPLIFSFRVKGGGLDSDTAPDSGRRKYIPTQSESALPLQVSNTQVIGLFLCKVDVRLYLSGLLIEIKIGKEQLFYLKDTGHGIINNNVAFWQGTLKLKIYIFYGLIICPRNAWK